MPDVELQNGRAYGTSIDDMRQYHGDSFKMYELAAPYVKNKNVIDLACGTGTGTSFLALHAKTVVGADIDDGAIAHCKKYHKNKNISFIQADATKKLPFKDGQFDVVTTFETIEHLYPAERKKYLHQLHRVLKKNGTMVLSTPQNGIDKQTRTIPPVKHIHDHKIEFHWTQLKQEIEAAGFTVVKVGGIQHGKGILPNKKSKTFGQKVVAFMSPVSKIIPAWFKEKIGARLLGYPYHINTFKYVEKHIERSNTFFVVAKKK
jgi:SAM-dependent methyltransferase